MDNIEKIRVKYGLEMLFQALPKYFLVIILAVLLGDIIGTIFALASFNVLRSVAYGLHARNSLQCVIISLLFFVIFPEILIYFNINIYLVYFITALTPLFFYKYAPSDTEKHPLVNGKLRKINKIKTVRRALLFMLTIIVVPSFTIKVYAFSGVVCQMLMNAPVTYYLFNERRNNYETYDGKFIEHAN